jgi:hypothetical protein
VSAPPSCDLRNNPDSLSPGIIVVSVKRLCATQVDEGRVVTIVAQPTNHHCEIVGARLGADRHDPGMAGTRLAPDFPFD